MASQVLAAQREEPCKTQENRRVGSLALVIEKGPRFGPFGGIVEKMIPHQLETARLILRPFKNSDSSSVFEYWQSDPAWERFNASVPENFGLPDAEEFIDMMLKRDRDVSPNWAIVHQGAVVGVVSLTFEQDHRIASIGYGIHSELRGRGVSVEGVSAVIGCAFKHYDDLRKIRALTSADNKPSHRVLQKLGFSHEGTLRQNQFVKNRFVDEAIFGLLREEWSHEP